MWRGSGVGLVKTTKDRHLSRQYELEDRGDRQKESMEETEKSDICFEGLKILVMVGGAGINQICTSLGKSKADSEKLNLVAQWAYKAILMASRP